MQWVPRANAKAIDFSNPHLNHAFTFYSNRYPRLCAHVAGYALGPRATLGILPSPRGTPFAVLVLNPKRLPTNNFDATEQMGIYLYYLARHLRYASRSAFPPPTSPKRPS